MENIQKALSNESIEKLARTIAQAIRPGVVPLLKAVSEFDASRKVILCMEITVIDFN